MADGKEPPDKEVGKYYKCHPKQSIGFVVCIVCEEVYHLSDFNRLKNTKFLSNIFVVCNSHSNITSDKSDIVLSADTKLLIAEIKEKAFNIAQEKLQHEVNLTLSNSSRNTSHDLTTFGDEDKDVKAVITENILLRQLNNELKQKNDLLCNTIELMKIDKKSYAEITHHAINRQTKIPDIKITSKSAKVDKDGTFKSVTEILQNEIKLSFKNVFDTNKNGTIIKCFKNDDVNKTSEILQNKLGPDFEINVQKPKNPTLKIFGFSSDFDDVDLENDINCRNFYSFNDKCKVLFTFKSANKTRGAIIEVTKELYTHIMNNNYRIYVGYHSCKAFENFNISLCNKCAGYNHKAEKCRNQTVKCIYCAGDHTANECNIVDKKLFKCANCEYANEKYGRKYDTSHVASDAHSCEILKKKLNIGIADTDYPVIPSLPNYIHPHLPFSKKRDKSAISNVLVTDAVKTGPLGNDQQETKSTKQLPITTMKGRSLFRKK